jgi:plasmid stabilization system protein ParE
MPHIIVTNKADEVFLRLKYFFSAKNSDAAKRMSDAITSAIASLKSSPYLGSPFGLHRRLIVDFGRSKYVVVYHFNRELDEIYILAMRHGREDLTHPEHGLNDH